MLYFSEHNYRGNHAGTKARNDVEEILKNSGGKPINKKQFILQTYGNEENIQSNVRNRMDLWKLYFDSWKVRNETVIIQYPILGFDFQKELFQIIRKNNRLVLLVHDIHSLRIPNGQKLQREIEILNMAGDLIIHNRFMEDKLKTLGVQVPMFTLNLFDYLCNNEQNYKDKELNKSVAFAGNLGKSSFLPEMLKTNPSVKFQLYGNGWNEESTFENAVFHGSFSPDEIPGILRGSFGLVWDGTGTKSGEGPLGEYMKINNPHKLSLYIAAGVPVIVWKKAAVAEFVNTNQIGIIVDQVNTLEKTLECVTNEQYKEMLQNVNKIRERIISGDYLGSVVAKL